MIVVHGTAYPIETIPLGWREVQMAKGGNRVNDYAVLAGFLGTGVEFVEALTIVLAVGTIRGWRSAILGAVTAAVLLIAMVIGIGFPLALVMRIFWVQLFVGLFMLLFGIRWLRKAILRYSGLKALHDEAESFAAEVQRQRAAGKRTGWLDRFGFLTTFSGTFLEGLEAILIVITVGTSANAMSSAVLGAVAATAAVIILGILVRKPLRRIPENAMKFVVGVMLTSFGAFWVGESLGVRWPQSDVAILYLAGSLLLFSWLLVARCRRALQSNDSQTSSTTGVSQ